MAISAFVAATCFYAGLDARKAGLHDFAIVLLCLASMNALGVVIQALPTSCTP
jgi:hypothetical protein